MVNPTNYNIIVATEKNGGIGFQQDIPWFYPLDLAYFKQKTSNSIVIMGSVTFDSIFKKLKTPLKNRINIVITSKPDKYKDLSEFSYLHIVSSAIEAIEKAEAINNLINTPPKKVFVIGGSSVYKQFMKYTEKIYITKIMKSITCDKYFAFDKKVFNKQISRQQIVNDDQVAMVFSVYSKH